MGLTWGEVDPRIPVLIGATIAVTSFSILRYRREKARLHHERGYDAADPNLNKEAWANTKATLRNTTTRGQLWLDVIRATILVPLCVLLAAAFCWAGFSRNSTPTQRWEMLGLGTFFGLGAFFLTRMALGSWRALKSNTGSQAGQS